MKTTWAAEDEAVLEEAYMMDAGVSIEMPMGKTQDLPPPPTIQSEVILPSSARRLNIRNASRSTILDVGFFVPVDEERFPKGRKIVASKLVHIYKED